MLTEDSRNKRCVAVFTHRRWQSPPASFSDGRVRDSEVAYKITGIKVQFVWALPGSVSPARQMCYKIGETRPHADGVAETKEA